MNIEAEVSKMMAMKVSELREKYREVFGDDTNTRNKQWLIKRIAWRIQANAMGGLSERAKRRAAELANDADVRILPPRSQPTIKFLPRMHAWRSASESSDWMACPFRISPITLASAVVGEAPPNLP